MAVSLNITDSKLTCLRLLLLLSRYWCCWQHFQPPQLWRHHHHHNVVRYDVIDHWSSYAGGSGGVWPSRSCHSQVHGTDVVSGHFYSWTCRQHARALCCLAILSHTQPISQQLLHLQLLQISNNNYYQYYYYYIWNLALADELFVLTLPFFCYATWTGDWIFGSVACKVNVHSFIHTTVLQFIHTFIHSLIHSFIHLFIYSFPKPASTTYKTLMSISLIGILPYAFLGCLAIAAALGTVLDLSSSWTIYHQILVQCSFCQKTNRENGTIGNLSSG